jgi:AhpD family alkylhydroperoxidase
MNTIIKVPSKSEVSVSNQGILTTVEKVVGFVPNLYATFAYSETALPTFLAAQNAASSLSGREQEAVSLVVSQVNSCDYCLSAHTVFAKKAGFSEEQTVELRAVAVSFDPKLDSLVKLAKSIAENKGHADPNLIEVFFNSGYTKANLVDLIMLVGIRSITNYLYSNTKVEIDWPAAPALLEAVN